MYFLCAYIIEMSTIGQDPWYLYVAGLPHCCCLVPPKRGAIRGGWPLYSLAAMSRLYCLRCLAYSIMHDSMFTNL